MEQEQKLNEIIKILRTIKLWVIFLGVTTIVSILFYLFTSYILINEYDKANKTQTWQERLN